MEKVLHLKFTQNQELRRRLLSTGSRKLIEDKKVCACALQLDPHSFHLNIIFQNDTFWGAGADGTGRNELGNALMRVRTSLQNVD
jgi:predicted NAD-dependent protein-ADP-ribosyltransferase YbiA (DUF1768 family)